MQAQLLPPCLSSSTRHAALPSCAIQVSPPDPPLSQSATHSSMSVPPAGEPAATVSAPSPEASAATAALPLRAAATSPSPSPPDAGLTVLSQPDQAEVELEWNREETAAPLSHSISAFQTAMAAVPAQIAGYHSMPAQQQQQMLSNLASLDQQVEQLNRHENLLAARASSDQQQQLSQQLRAATAAACQLLGRRSIFRSPQADASSISSSPPALSASPPAADCSSPLNWSKQVPFIGSLGPASLNMSADPQQQERSLQPQVHR